MTAPADVAGGLSLAEVPGLLEAAARRLGDRDRDDVPLWLHMMPGEVAEALAAMLRNEAWELARDLEGAAPLRTDESARERVIGSDLHNPGTKAASEMAWLIVRGWTSPEYAPGRPLSAPQSLQDGSPALPDTPQGVSGPLSAASASTGTGPQDPGRTPPGDPDGLGVPTAGSGAADGPDGLSGARGAERDSGGGSE